MSQWDDIDAFPRGIPPTKVEKKDEKVSKEELAKVANQLSDVQRESRKAQRRRGW